MTMELTTAIRNGFLDDTFQSMFISLHTADPGQTGANEVAGGSYARQAESFGAAASGAIANTGAITYTDMPACTPAYFGIWTLASGGTFRGGGPLVAAVPLVSGQEARFETGELAIEFPA